MLLETVAEFDEKNLSKEFKENLPQINYDINHMKNIIDDFSSYYAINLEKEHFFVKESIQNRALKILNSKITLKNIDINLQIKEELKIYSFEHNFISIIMILIDNSVDQFKDNRITNKIGIKITQNKNKILIEYQDNAGGIKITPIEDVFKPTISLKNDTKSSGLGLSLLSMQLYDKLDGAISVENKNGGAFFQIIISQQL